MTARLGAVGTLIWDTIEHPSAPATEQWGGAAYSLSALSAACPSGWAVEPIMKIGGDLWDPAIRMLREMPNVEIGRGVVRVPEPNNRVRLIYRDEARRREVLTGCVPGWAPAELLDVAAPLSALYVNFISGMEMELDAARAVREGFGGFIYGDLHSLFLGPPSEGPRTPRAPSDPAAWLACFDAVQMNDDELALLGMGAADLGDVLATGPSLAVVTRGADGAAYARRIGGAGSARVETGVVPVPGGRLAGDPTGCGDVWGATLVAAILSGDDLERAIERAHRAAAAKIADPRVDRLRHTLASSDPRRGVLP